MKYEKKTQQIFFLNWNSTRKLVSKVEMKVTSDIQEKSRMFALEKSHRFCQKHYLKLMTIHFKCRNSEKEFYNPII